MRPTYSAKRPVDSVLLAEPLGLRLERNLGTDADHHARHVVIVRDRLDEPFLFRAVVHQRAHAAEDARRQREADRFVPLCRRHENGARRHRLRAVIRVIVAIAEEKNVVVSRVRGAQMPQERRALRPFGVEPLQLVEMRMRVVEHAIGPAAEHMRIARVIDSKPAHGNAVHHVRARRIVVPPRHVIARARREHLDVGVLRQGARRRSGRAARRRR